MQDRLVADISGKPHSMDELNNNDFLPEPLVEIDLSQQHQHLKRKVEDILSQLTLREQQVLGLRFALEDGKPRTFQQIGDVMGLSEKTARRAERSGLLKLRQPRS